MRRKQLAAALAVATATSLLIAPQASAGPARTIQWQKCSDIPGAERLECGSFTAPMDWNHPRNGKTVTIAVSRLRPADGTARTTLFTNPGGPGGPGRSLPLLYLNRQKLSEHTEIIGIDVRGTGASSNVTCDGFDAAKLADPRDRGKANLDLIYGNMERQARLCQQRSGELGRHITTEQAVRDFDLLRQLLGRKKVSWLGYSGGTWLGAYYATYFPKTLDKIVLDSNVDFTGPWQNVFDDWGMGFERRFRVDFLPWVAKYDNVYHLGKTGEEVRLAYENTRKKLAEHPVQLPEGLFNPMELDGLLQGTLYNKGGFEIGARFLARLAGTMPVQLTAQAGYPDAPNSTAYAFMCNDTPFHGGREFLEREAAVNGAKWPLNGYYQTMAPCAYWDRPNVNLKQPNGIGAPKTLMVQSVRDPATPLEGARQAHRNFRNTTLLTVENEGDHGIYGFGNDCVNDIVESYLVDGVTPAKDLTCQGVPLPEPGQQVQNPLVENRRLAAQLGW